MQVPVSGAVVSVVMPMIASNCGDYVTPLDMVGVSSLADNMPNLLPNVRSTNCGPAMSLSCTR